MGNFNQCPNSGASSLDSLSVYLQDAWKLNSSYEPSSSGRKYRSPMGEFVRPAKAHSDLGRMDELEALSAIERCLRSWGIAAETEVIWAVLFPTSDDATGVFIYT